MLIYEKNNKLNINFENEINEDPDIQISKENGETQVLIDGQPVGSNTPKSVIADEQTVTPEPDESMPEFYNKITIIPNENFDQTNLPSQIELVIDEESILLTYEEFGGEFFWGDGSGSDYAEVEDDNIIFYYLTDDGYDDKTHTVTIYAVEDAASGLPPVTSYDDGSVLTVVNGEWDKVTLPDERTKELFYGVNFFKGIPMVSWRPISINLSTVNNQVNNLPIYYYTKLFEKIGYVFFTSTFTALSNAANNGSLTLKPEVDVVVPLYATGSDNTYLGKLAGYISITAQTGTWTVTKTDSDMPQGTPVNGFCLFPLATTVI